MRVIAQMTLKKLTASASMRVLPKLTAVLMDTESVLAKIQEPLNTRFLGFRKCENRGMWQELNLV